jgi:hypothetical protein
MIEPLKELKNDPNGPFDAIFFLPGDGENEIHIPASHFKNKGEKVGGSEIGDTYEVVLFKEDNENDRIHSIDQFEAIFSDPYEYISNLIPQDWYGVLVKKTTTSGVFVKEMVDNLQAV